MNCVPCNFKRSESSARMSVRGRSAYTLIELLIVISILVILLTMTMMAVKFTRDGDRVSGAAAQVQSFLGGARDRAIYARAPRGVRFFLDVNNPRAVSSMVYIDPSETWSDGVIQLRRWDPELDGQTNTVSPPPAAQVDINEDGVADDPTQLWMVTGAGTAWWELKRRGMLFDGMRIRIPKGPQGSWYPINTRLINVDVAPTQIQILILGIPYRDPGDTPVARSQAFESGGPEDYELQLPPKILPTEPVILPQGTVIDLDSSKVPTGWRPPLFAIAPTAIRPDYPQYSQYIDLVYSPRGNLIGEAAAGGVIHFYVCDSEDSIALKDAYVYALDPGSDPHGWELFNAEIRAGVFVPTDEINSTIAPWIGDLGSDEKPYLVKDRRIVTVFSQTGAVSIHPVNSGGTGSNGFLGDPFYFAETGEIAK